MSKSLLIMSWQNRADKLAKKVPSMEKMGLGGLKISQNWQKKGENEYLGSKMNMREFLFPSLC